MEEPERPALAAVGREHRAPDRNRRRNQPVGAGGDALTERLVEERNRQPAAVAERRLRDDDGNREKPFPLEQPLADVEATILGIPEQAAAALGSQRSRRK